MEKVEGWNLQPILAGTVDGGEVSKWQERPLYWHMPHFWGPRGPGIQPFSSIRRGPWKMIYYHHPEPKRVLFQLQEDLGESRDVAQQNPQILQSLSKQLANHLRQTGASLPSRDGRRIPMPDELDN